MKETKNTRARRSNTNRAGGATRNTTARRSSTNRAGGATRKNRRAAKPQGPRYDDRILGVDEKVSCDTRISGISNNVMVIASSGAGKTGSYLYPNLKNSQNQSLIVSDSKGHIK